MEMILLTDNPETNAIFRFARKNYKVYVEHYKSRNFTPMPF